MGTAVERASQPLSFRLLRLRSPSLHTSSHPAFDLATDIISEGHKKDDNDEHRFTGSTAATQEDLSSKRCGFEDRVLLRELPQQLGLTGTLLLPQEFGRVYIGQQLCLAIVMQNASRTVPVHCVGVKVEMLNDRSRAVLYDTSGEDDLPTIGAGEHHEILIRRDMKDLGNTTLMVKAWFLLPGSSNKLYQGGSFVFEVSNPLTVRTKVRKIEPSHQILLEATLINQTEETMILETVDLIPSKHFRCEAIPPPLPRAVSDLSSGPILDACFDKPWLPPQGGAFSFVYCLSTIESIVSGAPSATHTSGGGIGKLDIRWRGPMGAYARLQTQSISGYEDVRCAGDGLMLRVVNIKPNRRLELYEACTVEISVHNHSRDQSFGPVILSMSDPTPPSGAISTDGDEINEHIPRRGVVLNGEQEIEIQQVSPGEAVVATMSFLPLHKGRHYLQGIVLTDAKDGRVYDRLPAVEVFVH